MCSGTASLREAAVLAAHEYRMVFKRVLQLYAEPCPGTLNVAHLSAIHHALFQDVYSWAGQFRTGNYVHQRENVLSGGNAETSLDLLLDQVTQEQQLAGLQADQFAERAAFYLGELKHHPPFSGWQWQNAARVHPNTRVVGRSQGTVGTHLEVRDGQRVRAVFATNRPSALVYVVREAIGLSN